MKSTPLIILLSWTCTASIISFGQDANLPLSQTSPGTRLEQWKQADLVARKDAEIRLETLASLKADLGTPWTSVIISLNYSCSCTGSYQGEVEINRTGDATTIAPWGPLHPGEARDVTHAKTHTQPLTHYALEKVLSETSLHFFSALLSVTPADLAGAKPKLQDPAALSSWHQKRSAAGGSPIPGDSIAMEIQIFRPGEVKRHSSYFNDYDANEFAKWIAGLAQRGPDSAKAKAAR